MNRFGIDQNALVDAFAQANARQAETLRTVFADATLKALQGRELSLANMRSVVKTMTASASAAAAGSGAPPVDVEAMLSSAVAGMDDALLRAVEANRTALQRFVDQGADLREKPLKAALANLEKMEDMFFGAVAKAAESAPVPAVWNPVLETMRQKGSDSGAGAARAVQQLTEQAQQTIRDTRAAGMRGAQAMMDGYAALVSGVLIGMSEALSQRTPASPAAAGKRSGRK